MGMTKATVKISTNNAKLGLTTKDYIEVEVPQVESFEDAATFFNGADKAIAFLNGAIATNAGNGARQVLRSEKFETKEDCIAKAKEVALAYSPQSAATGISQKKAKEAVDTIKARLDAGESLSREELLELLAGAGSK